MQIPPSGWPVDDFVEWMVTVGLDGASTAGPNETLVIYTGGGGKVTAYPEDWIIVLAPEVFAVFPGDLFPVFFQESDRKDQVG